MKKIIAFLILLVFANVMTAGAKVTENEVLSIVQIIIFDGNDEVLSTGSGVVIDGEGRILTNYHVLEDYYAYDDSYMLVCMTFDATEESACIVVATVEGLWANADLALLQMYQIYDFETEEMIEVTDFLNKYDVTFNHVYFNKQVMYEENVELGDELQILGYPGVGGTTITYTKGTVSGFERMYTDEGSSPYLIKTDASINPGNSGGGAFDQDNFFVGIPSIGTFGMGDMAYVISLPIINSFLVSELGEEYMREYDLYCGENAYLGEDLFCYCEDGYEWSEFSDDCVLAEGGDSLSDGGAVDSVSGGDITDDEWVLFTDVGAGYKYLDAIAYVKDMGVVEGYSDGTFKPFNEINRAEFVKILVEAKYQEYLQDYKPDSCFSDVDAAAWYAKYVCYAKDKGIIGGYPDGTFKPAQNVNVVETLKIVLETYFGNVDPVEGEWYQKYVDYALKHDFWLDEWTDNAYLLKRGEMAELIYRSLTLING